MKTHFSPFPTLLTERLELRQLVKTDAPEILIQRSDERILQFIEIEKAETLADAHAFIQKIESNVSEGQSLYWAICLRNEEDFTQSRKVDAKSQTEPPQSLAALLEKKLIGTICLWNLDPENSIAEVGYSFLPDFWGKGYAHEALAAVVEFGFSNMQATIIEATTRIDNLGSIKLLEKSSFVKTGMDGSYAVYALCRPPFGKTLFETDRLRFREITPEDAPFLLKLLNTPDWLANIGDRQVHHLDDARKYAIHRLMAAYHKSGFGFYMLERISDLASLGICGLVKRDFLDDVDIGYGLLPEYYGNGYALEAAAAMLLFAKQKLAMPRLAAITIESNKPSQRVLERIGLRFERKFFAPGDDEELMLWGVEF